MKAKKIRKKLCLSKKTITNFNVAEMNRIQGGDTLRCLSDPPIATCNTCGGYTCDPPCR